jgi:hypothetical protein
MLTAFLSASNTGMQQHHCMCVPNAFPGGAIRALNSLCSHNKDVQTTHETQPYLVPGLVLAQPQTAAELQGCTPASTP